MKKLRCIEEKFIDSDNKIIVDCPDCGSQNLICLISCNKLIENELSTQWCDSCKKHYVVQVECELECKTLTWATKNP